MSCSSTAAASYSIRSIEELESRYLEALGASRADSPRHVRSSRYTSARSSVAASCSFDHVDRQQLAALGDVRTAGLADLFVAVIGNETGNQANHAKGAAR